MTQERHAASTPDDAADVIGAVDFAREHHLTLAVRGGGHNGPGLGSCDGGRCDRTHDLAVCHIKGLSQ
jgi:FAD/FMN-containing dehydrogenase